MVTCGGCALQQAGSEHVGKDDLDVEGEAQDIMFGREGEETATRLREKLTDVRKNGVQWWVRPDGKTS